MPKTPCEMFDAALEALQAFDEVPEGSVLNVTHRGRRTEWAERRRADLVKAVEYWARLCPSKGAAYLRQYSSGRVGCLGPLR